jgi:pyruvate/2-oxoglutarate dehydrogenase complex dihydrolipoamide dehydrogenase (E3) component
MNNDYDLAVIGAGSAGLVAATFAQRAGLKTVLIEKNKIGGECLHTGCVPSKTFINSAKIYASAKNTVQFGLPSFKPVEAFSFSNVMEHVNEVIQHIYKDENPEVFSKMGIDVFVDPSGAEFLNNTEIKIGKEILRAKNTIICTGSSPKRLQIPDELKSRFFDNENFWSIRKQPRKILFIGGGIITAEISQSLRTFGSEVTIVEHNDRILKVVDQEVASIIIKKFIKEGINIMAGAEVESYKQTGDNIEVVIKTKDEKIITKEFDSIFVATGREPNIKGMHLENAGIKFDSKGIITNPFFQTSTENIYACGDVTSKYKFTHAASHQAEICLKNIMNANSKQMNEELIPWAIFTEPEIAHTGLSEIQAKEKFKDVKVFKVDATIDRFITEGKTDGFLKVIFNDNNLCVGAEAVGAHAGEWIQILSLAIKNQIPIDSISETIFIYPTFSEIAKKAFTRFQRTLKKA